MAENQKSKGKVTTVTQVEAAVEIRVKTATEQHIIRKGKCIF